MNKNVTKGREIFLEHKKNSLVPSKFPKYILSDFADWCQARKIDVFVEDLKGENFKQFLSEREKGYLQSAGLAEKLIHLYKLKPSSKDESTDFVVGYDSCLNEAIKTRGIPGKRNPISYPESCVKIIEGYNAAVNVLKIEYFHLF